MGPLQQEDPQIGRERRGDGDGRARGGADGAPGTIRGGGVSESVAKAPRGGIGGEKKRGISTFLLRRPGSIRAFATDLDKRRRHGPERAAASRAEAAAGAPIGRAGPRGCPPWSPSGPRRRPPGRPRTPRRALRTRKCSSNRRSRVQNAPFESRMHISTTRRPVAVLAGRGDGPARTTPRPPTRAIMAILATSRRSRREGPTDGETGARAGGRMHILAACGAPARGDHDQERT